MILIAAPVSAATYRVGFGTGCHFNSLAAAMNAARSNPGHDHLLINQGMANGPRQIVIEGGQDLTLTGGYTSCTDTDPGLDKTVFSGEGGVPGSIFTIRGPGVIRLENLVITKGNALGDGGGIWYQGSSVAGTVNTLVLARTTLESNVSSGDGGGIWFSGGERYAELKLENDTGIFRNIAQNSGGGIALEGNAHLKSETHRLFFHGNVAYLNNGGAIHVRQPANADIGSATWDAHATFSDNFAKQSGGAIHVESTDASRPASIVRLYSINPSLPMKFVRNKAEQLGGSFSAVGAASTTSEMPKICTRSINVHEGQALVASVAMMRHAEYGHCGVFPKAAVATCVPASNCGNYSDHVGGPIALEGRARASFRNARFDRNHGSLGTHFRLRDLDGRSPTLDIANSTITPRFTMPQGSVVEVQGSGNVSLRHTTISEIFIADRRAIFKFYVDATLLPKLTLDHVVVNTPGVSAFSFSSARLPELTFNQVMVTNNSLPNPGDYPTLVMGDPKLSPCAVDSLPCNPIPLPDSPVIDFAPYTAAEPFDINGARRPVDLGHVIDRFGPTDLGAFEVQK